MKRTNFRKCLAVFIVMAMVISLLPAIGASRAKAASYVRIRNVWQNTYLYQSGDKVVYGNPASNNTASHWEFVSVSGDVYRIRNRQTGDYMHIENQRGYVQCGSINMDWHSARWRKPDAGNGEVRIRNYWQSSQYIHVENLNGNAQIGGIYTAWSSAKWVLENVTEQQTQPQTQAPQTQPQTQAPQTQPANTQQTTTYNFNNNTNVGGGATKGGSGIENLHIDGAYAEFYNVNGGNGGNAEITINYASNDGSPKLSVYVNNNYVTTANLSYTGGWGNYSGRYTFNANLIRATIQLSLYTTIRARIFQQLL